MHYDVIRPMTSQIHSYEIGKSIFLQAMVIYGASHYAPRVGNLEEFKPFFFENCGRRQSKLGIRQYINWRAPVNSLTPLKKGARDLKFFTDTIIASI